MLDLVKAVEMDGKIHMQMESCVLLERLMIRLSISSSRVQDSKIEVGEGEKAKFDFAATLSKYDGPCVFSYLQKQSN